MDGRFRHCIECDRVEVLCGPCASVGARCQGCASARRLKTRRQANHRYAHSEAGRASNQKRQADWRARHLPPRRRVTDTSLPEGSAPPTALSPSDSMTESTRDPEVAIDEEENSKPRDVPDTREHTPTLRQGHAPTRVPTVLCPRCGRVLSGFIRPSEQPGPRVARRRRVPRQPGLRVVRRRDGVRR